MGIDFGKAAQQTPVQAMPQNVPPAEEEPVFEEYDIAADREQMSLQLVNSPEVDALASQIEVYNPETIVSFGSEAADEISKASDVVLNSMNMSQLKQYESEIKQSNKKLAQMFDANVAYYHELVKYILAGEQGCRELEAYIAQRQADMESTGDNSIRFELQNLQQALMMLEQRTQDLRMAENVAMQSIPMIKMMEFSNINLVRKINSAFIVTLPVFKQALAQAMLLKRQKIQAEAMAALDQKTNEMLIKNAQNTAEQSKMTARLASGSSIQIETLEKTWRTIMNGIDETQRIQEEARKKRIDDQARLETIKNEFNQKYHIPDAK